MRFFFFTSSECDFDDNFRDSSTDLQYVYTHRYLVYSLSSVEVHLQVGYPNTSVLEVQNFSVKRCGNVSYKDIRPVSVRLNSAINSRSNIGSTLGRCVLTLGTGETVAPYLNERLHLLPAHCYAVIGLSS